jgi:hypothetical protein
MRDTHKGGHKKLKSLVPDSNVHNRWRQGGILWSQCFVCKADRSRYADYTDGTLRCLGCGVVLLTPELGHPSKE